MKLNKKLLVLTLATTITGNAAFAACDTCGSKAMNPGDSSIYDKLDAKIDSMPMLDDDVSFSVDNCVITLTGVVDNYEERQSALKTAMSIPGVRAVKNMLQVDRDTETTSFRSGRRYEDLDDKISRNLDKMIDRNNDLDDDIGFDVTNGVISLNGTVDNPSEKQRALEIAMNIPGAKAVRNSIKVEDSYNYQANNESSFEMDNQILSDLDQMIDNADELDDDIGFDANDGILTLNGTVDNANEKNKAMKLAMKVPNVRAIKNNIKVESEKDFETVEDKMASLPRNTMDTREMQSSNMQSSDSDSEMYLSKNDQKLTDSINFKYFWSTSIDADEVKVEANDGVVTLSGWVETPKAKQLATRKAIEAGAVKVNNNLSISAL
jgi:osmotically-inducible protein OsmY